MVSHSQSVTFSGAFSTGGWGKTAVEEFRGGGGGRKGGGGQAAFVQDRRA